ncbi:hypothetical protein AB0J74_18190 [Asanoa sp. NPDC049573]
MDAHLLAMTEHQVTDQLRDEGETVHVRGEDGVNQTSGSAG